MQCQKRTTKNTIMQATKENEKRHDMKCEKFYDEMHTLHKGKQPVYV